MAIRFPFVGYYGFFDYTVAVPGVRLGDDTPALHTDRSHSLESLFPPLAALLSLPQNDSLNLTTLDE